MSHMQYNLSIMKKINQSIVSSCDNIKNTGQKRNVEDGFFPHSFSSLKWENLMKQKLLHMSLMKKKIIEDLILLKNENYFEWHLFYALLLSTNVLISYYILQHLVAPFLKNVFKCVLIFATSIVRKYWKKALLPRCSWSCMLPFCNSECLVNGRLGKAPPSGQVAISEWRQENFFINCYWDCKKHF